ncbi:MAG: hypothetical protein IT210_15650 [Armatimonadetes bacterium]|nr:hypothetical protein [Armatimonadota bacterium]
MAASHQNDALPGIIRITDKLLYEDTISPFIYGDFMEPLNDLLPGMWAEKIEDRSFAGTLQPGQTWPPDSRWDYPRWHSFVCGVPFREASPTSHPDFEMPTASAVLEMDPARPFCGRQSAKVTVSRGDGKPFVAGIIQEGMSVREGEKLNFEMYLRGEIAGEGTVKALLGRSYGVFFRAYAELEWKGVTGEWQKHCGQLISGVTDEEAALMIGLSGEGVFWADKVSLMPETNLCGWRPDVVEAVRALTPRIIRFGGSSLIYYQWENGIGPRERRAPFENRPWGNMEENDVGLHEFLQFCELVAAEPLICLNSNSTAIGQILDEIEYCNGPADSPYGRIRAEMGHPEPFHVRFWQIGNEQSGEAYERTMAEYAHIIRQQYPDLVLMASYPSDNILQNLSGDLDYICPHYYTPYSPEGEAGIVRLIERIRQEGRNPDLKIGLTEWNHTAGHWGWGRAWLLTLYNALNAARMFNMFHRLGDRVRIANRSNLTNSCCSGVLQTSTSGLYLTPCYHVQKAYANLSGDQALQVEAAAGETLDVSATRRSQDGEIALFAVNDRPLPRSCAIIPEGIPPGTRAVRVWTLTGPSLSAVNSFQEKERVAPTETEFHGQGGSMAYTFPPHSVTILRFEG